MFLIVRYNKRIAWVICWVVHLDVSSLPGALRGCLCTGPRISCNAPAVYMCTVSQIDWSFFVIIRHIIHCQERGFCPFCFVIENSLDRVCMTCRTFLGAPNYWVTLSQSKWVQCAAPPAGGRVVFGGCVRSRSNREDGSPRISHPGKDALFLRQYTLPLCIHSPRLETLFIVLWYFLLYLNLRDSEISPPELQREAPSQLGAEARRCYR